MRKFFVIFALASFFFLISSDSADAFFYRVGKDGSIVQSVLADQDSVLPDTSQIELKKVNEKTPDVSSKIALVKKDSDIFVRIGDGSGDDLRVGENTKDVIEVEERPMVRKMSIGTKDGKFYLYQDGVTATTDFPITVDAQSAKILVQTQNGNIDLPVLPLQAVNAVLKSRLSSVIQKSTVVLTEKENTIVYKVNGQKVINFLNMYDYTIPVNSVVSAKTGEVTEIDAPFWYKVFGFLLTHTQVISF